MTDQNDRLVMNVGRTLIYIPEEDTEAREWLLGLIEAAYGLIDTLTINAPAHETREDVELLQEKIEELGAFLPVRTGP